MIADSLQFIDRYRSLPYHLYEGLVFIRDTKPDLPVGEYPVHSNIKAIVSEYQTTARFERGYEAHRRVVDIQYPLVGLEKIKWSPLNGMKVHIEYDPSRDRAFYINPVQESHVIIGDGVFGIFFPEDAHGPQHFVEKPEKIKKLTLKVEI
jgi:YhcH/YjgK/YiaL family protein